MKNTIKRANALNESHYRLKEVTQRVLALAIEQAQEIKELTGQDLVMAGSKTIVVADYYAKIYGVDRDTAYTALREAVENLYQAEYHWREIDENGDINEYKTRFVSHIGYLGGKGAIEFCLTEQARQHILNLTKNFTWYEIRQLSNLSKYGIRLYEILCQYRSTGKLIIKINELKHRLGLLPNEYEYLGNFKARVLDFAIDEVLKLTDLEKLEYEQEKQGRTIIGFKFSFKFKTKEKPKILEYRDSETIDMLDGLTDNEKAIIKATADKYIFDRAITDENHRANIQQKAITERWGLSERDKQVDDFNAQNQAVLAQIEAERLEKQRIEQERFAKEQENQKFIKYFESLPIRQQAEVLNLVRIEVQNLPVIGQMFVNNMETAYKDVMYRSYFKKIMSL